MRTIFFIAFTFLLIWIVGTRLVTTAVRSPDASVEDVHPVEVTGVYIEPGGASPFILLTETDGDERSLPIWIGYAEADAIRRRIAGEEPPRPLTHEFMTESIARLGVRVERVIVTALQDNMFFARVDFGTGVDDTVSVEARPSDAIALALGSRAPIFVSEAVMREAGERDILTRPDRDPLADVTGVGCGIWCQDIDRELSAALGVDSGVVVSDLGDDQEASGVLLRGDVILTLAGQPATDVEVVKDLLSGLEGGDVLPIEILRGSDRMEVTLTCR